MNLANIATLDEISTNGDWVHMHFTSTKPFENATLRVKFRTDPTIKIPPYVEDFWHSGWHFLDLFWFMVRKRRNPITGETTNTVLTQADFEFRTVSLTMTKTNVTITNELLIEDEHYLNYARLDLYGCIYTIFINGKDVGSGYFEHFSR